MSALDIAKSLVLQKLAECNNSPETVDANITLLAELILGDSRVVLTQVATDLRIDARAQKAALEANKREAEKNYDRLIRSSGAAIAELSNASKPRTVKVPKPAKATKARKRPPSTAH